MNIPNYVAFPHFSFFGVEGGGGGGGGVIILAGFVKVMMKRI